MRLAVILTVATWAAPALAQQAPASCSKDVDCPGEMVCDHARCVLPAGAKPPPATGVLPPPSAEPAQPQAQPQQGGLGLAPSAPLPAQPEGVGPPPSRVAFVFQPNIPITSSDLSFTSTAINLGIAFSTPLGYSGARYQLDVMYTTVNGVSGARLDPLQFGFDVPVFKQDKIKIDVEPVVSALNIQMLSGDGETVLMFGPGVSVGAVASYQQFFAVVEPIGFDMRIFGLAFGGGSATDFSAALDYRLRLGVGLQL